MTQKLHVSMHAIDRAKERLDVKGTNENVAHTLRQWYTRSVRKGRDGTGGIIFDNIAKDVRLILDETCQTVITTYRLSTVDDYVAQKLAPKLTVERISAAIKRELSRMTTQLRREIRKLTEQQAQLNVSIAELTLNKVRCKAPHTQALIQTRIDAIITQVDSLAQEVDAKLTQIKVAEREVSEVVGE
ncbi:hypothetical protein ACQKNX_24475 [Lysinibacillus sp. NPDC093712]|uniref:hypothetical protein n=1 Tax=Lysinibacillus sp. NPDC093712 TaxID=3390579 RepID=UPI003D01A80C